MAVVQIPALPAATPLTGAEKFPLDQGGVTKYATIGMLPSGGGSSLPWIDLRSYASGSGNEAAAVESALTAAAAAGKALYHPPGLSIYTGTHVIKVPNNTLYILDGELWSDAVVGDGTPQTAYAFLENAAWQTAGAASNIRIVGNGRLRRTVNITGSEGPYDRGIRIRGCTGIQINARTIGGLGGVLLEGCDEGIPLPGSALAVMVESHEPGDAALSMGQDWGPGSSPSLNVPRAARNLVVGAVAYNAGYLLNGTTVVPSGINGSSVVITQDGVDAHVRSVNPRHNAFETGDTCKNLKVHVHSYVDIAGRIGNALIAACSDVDVWWHCEIHNGGLATVNVVGAASQTQQSVRIHNPTGTNDYSAAGFNPFVVTLGKGTDTVSVLTPVGEKMGAVSADNTYGASAVALANVTVIDPYSVEAAQMGVYSDGVTGLHVQGGNVLRPGTDGAALDKLRVGYHLKGGTGAVKKNDAVGDGFDMRWGFVFDGGVWTQDHNESTFHTTAGISKLNSPTLNAPGYVS